MNDLKVTIEQHEHCGIIAWFDDVPGIVVQADTIEEAGVELLKSLIADQVFKLEYSKPANILHQMDDNKYSLAFA